MPNRHIPRAGPSAIRTSPRPPLRCGCSSRTPRRCAMSGLSLAPGHERRDFLCEVAPGERKMWSARARPGEWFSYANLPWGSWDGHGEGHGRAFDRFMQRVVVEPVGCAGGFRPRSSRPKQLERLATLYRKRRARGQREMGPLGPWVPRWMTIARRQARAPCRRRLRAGKQRVLFGPQGTCEPRRRTWAASCACSSARGEIDGRASFSAKTVDLMCRGSGVPRRGGQRHLRHRESRA